MGKKRFGWEEGTNRSADPKAFTKLRNENMGMIWGKRFSDPNKVLSPRSAPVLLQTLSDLGPVHTGRRCS